MDEVNENLTDVREEITPGNRPVGVFGQTGQFKEREEEDNNTSRDESYEGGNADEHL